MVCHGCHRVSPGRLCGQCAANLKAAPDRILPGGIRSMAAFVHTGVAARLVHDFKYRGVGLVLDLAVPSLAQRLPAGLTFCPIPRVLSRYVRFGVDPADLFARALAKTIGGAFVAPLARPIHSPRRAGSNRQASPPLFKSKGSIGARLVLVDDVLTSGATVLAAARAVGEDRVLMAATITSAPRSSILKRENQVSSP